MREATCPEHIKNPEKKKKKKKTRKRKREEPRTEEPGSIGEEPRPHGGPRCLAWVAHRRARPSLGRAPARATQARPRGSPCGLGSSPSLSGFFFPMVLLDLARATQARPRVPVQDPGQAALASARPKPGSAVRRAAWVLLHLFLVLFFLFFFFSLSSSGSGFCWVI